MDDDTENVPAAPPAHSGGPAEELGHRLGQQALTADFGKYALRVHNISQLLQEATRVCALGLHSEYCKIMEYLGDDAQFLVRAGVGWRPGVVGHARMGADAASPTGYAYQTGKPVISNHLAKETRFRTPALLVEHGIKRAINVIIQGDRAPFGVLEVDSPIEGKFTDSDVAFLQGFANLLGVAIERQNMEDALRASELRLQDANARQELLTHEISHRVKNSLGMVAGLLSLQKSTSSDPVMRGALDDARTRVMTIALVHDRLWRANEVDTVNLAEFMEELCNQIRALLGARQTLTWNFVDAVITTDQAVPLALVANELLTNAFKYAYPSGEGEVRITIEWGDPGQLHLIVRDFGQGLPENLNASESKSLGMKLITNLGRQLGGRVEWANTYPGTRVVFQFPSTRAPRESSGGRGPADPAV